MQCSFIIAFQLMKSLNVQNDIHTLLIQINIKNQQTKLRKVMLSWVDNEMQEKIVEAIKQMAHSHYAIVSHMSVLPEVRTVIFAILEVLCQELGLSILS